MSDSVKLVECPRDAWQGLKGQIPAYIKTDYLKALISAGFKHIDAVSFVSPKAVPQMADSEEVLKELDPPDDVEIIGIVVNEKGAQRAIATEAVRTLGFPVFGFADFPAEQSAPDSGRCDRRTGKDQEQRRAGRARHRGLHLDGIWQSVRRSMEHRRSGRRSRSSRIATAFARSRWRTRWEWPGQRRFANCFRRGEFEVSTIWRLELHLHSRPEQAAEKILAAYDAGCRRFDSALGRTGRMSLCAGCVGGKYRDRESVIEALASKRRGVAAR